MQRFIKSCRASRVTQDLTGRTALIVGGTKGIGAEVANRLKERGATTYVAGRSTTPASNLHTYLPADLSTIRGINDFIRLARSRLPAKDVMLIQCSGHPPNGTLNVYQTVDKDFCVQCFGRLFVARDLAPQTSSIVWVAAPGGGYLDVNDIQTLKSTWTPLIVRQFLRDSAFLDISAAMIAQERGAKITHTFPGIVATEGYRNLFWKPVEWMQGLLLRTIGTSAVDYSEVPAYYAMNPSQTNEARFTSGGRSITPSTIANDALKRQAVLDWSMEKRRMAEEN